MLSGNTILIKEMNKDLVRGSLKILRKATKQELSIKTGLSVVTINTLLTEMIHEKEVFEGEMIPSNGGRPSMVYYYNENYRFAIVIYGHQKEEKNLIRLVVVNLIGERVYCKESYMDVIQIDSFDDMIMSAILKFPATGILGFGLPGEAEDGIITLNDYDNLVGDSFIRYYKEKYRIPVIFVNDVNAAVNGNYYYKSPGNTKSLIGLYFPRIYMPGAGIIIGGEIYSGKSSFAGEIGNLPIGIDWLSLNYYNIKEVTKAIGELLAILSCILAPEQFVLYGDFWKSESNVLIKEYAENRLLNKFSINVSVSDKFEEDFELGMIKYSLEKLESKLVITRKGL